MRTDSESERVNEFPQVVRVRTHTFRSDVPADTGGRDEAPGPHDYFDAALATCKGATAMWFAKRNGIALERTEVHIDRDGREEKHGKYVLRVQIVFHGPLTDEQRGQLTGAVSRCPIHKLMTTSDVIIENAPAT